MQIHELNTFSGNPGAGDYLAIDDGNTTKKVEADKLGVTTQMTKAEAEAGTGTDPRVITPKVLHDYVETKEVLVIDIASFSSLPLTVSNANITSDMVVVNSELGTPSSMTGDWTVATSNGSLMVSGSISGSTTLKLYLMKSR